MLRSNGQAASACAHFRIRARSDWAVAPRSEAMMMSDTRKGSTQ
jgi:hypothetical protein